MRVDNVQNINFKGALNNKFVLSALEKISDNSASFCAMSAVGASLLLRPLAISLTPNVKKENKNHSIAKSVSSGLIKLASTLVITLPVENAIKNIEKTPDKFLNNNAKDFIKDKNSFNFASQLLKLSSNILSAVPKSFITISLIPLFLKKFFSKTPENKKEISFTGKLEDNFTKFVSNYFNFDSIQKFAQKNKANSTDIARNMTVLGDMLLTGSFILGTKKSKKIAPERKNNLILNSLVTTGLSALGGITVDKFVQKQSKGLIDKFISANKSDPKLAKYLQGINILRPTVIFALIYYGILPIASNYLSQRISDKVDKKNNI